MIDDIVSVLLSEDAEVAVVARLQPSADLAEDFRRSGADVLVCTHDEAEMASRWRAWIERSSLPAVLNLGADGASGRVYAIQAHDFALSMLSGESLLAALHALSVGHAR
jgi:hypothetical protein